MMKGLSCLFWKIVGLTIVGSGIWFFSALGQEPEVVRCGTTIHNIPEEQREYLKWLDQAVADYISQNYMRNSDLNSLPVITIPVVVHVLYNTAQENVPDNVIQALIDTLNKDFMSDRPEVLGQINPLFRHLVGNPRIQFCLATVDPNGNPTDGIIRTQTTTSCFSDNSMKSQSPAWDPGRYLNIWIVDLCGGTLGFATFPGGPSSLDGVVIDYAYLPGGSYPYNEGRTTTHEVGHWLGLYHIWGDGTCSQDDQVGDTPPADGAHYICSTSPLPQCGFPDRMIQNYMDYTPEACLLMFTKGQALRMRAVMEIDTRRARLKYSNGCSAPGTYDLAIVALEEKMYPNHTDVQLCEYKVQPVVTIKNIGAVQSPSAVVNCTAGGTTVSFNLPALNPTQQVNVTMPEINLPEGNYEVVCRIVSNESVQYNNIMKYKITTPVSCSYFEDFETTEYPSVSLHLDSVLQWWAYQWVLSSRNDIIGSDGNPTIAFMFPGYWAASGQTSMFKTPFIYLSPTTTNVKLTFDVSYAPYGANSNEKLEVYVIDFCGLRVTPVGSWTGQQLATAPATTNEWYPSSASHWDSITIDLSQFKGRTISIAFKATSAKGNNIYVDNIRIQSANCEPFVSATTAMAQNSQPFSIIPSGIIWQGTTTEVKIDIYELSGKHIVTKKEILRPGQKILFAELHQGVYLVRLTDVNSQKSLGTHKLTVIH